MKKSKNHQIASKIYLQFSKPVYQLLPEQYTKLNGVFMYPIRIYHRNDTTTLQSVMSETEWIPDFRDGTCINTTSNHCRVCYIDKSHSNEGFNDLTKHFTKAMVTYPREWNILMWDKLPQKKQKTKTYKV